MSRLPPKIVQYFLLAGFLVPCLLNALLSIGNLREEGQWEWVVMVTWPAIGFYMSADGHDKISAVFAFLVSAIANSLVYGLVGYIISFFHRRFFRRST